MSQPANDEFSQHLSDDEASNHEDASDTGAAPKQQQQVIPQTTAISNIKLPILKKEEYDIWAMEMEHYLEYIDNEDGIVRVLSPVTAAEIQVVEKERNATNILLMAIPKEHMRRFHGMDDAKEIWEAIRTRFGGNANSKKMQKAVFKQQFEAFKISNSEGLEKGYDRFQQLLSQLEAHGAEVSTEDANHKFLRSLPPAWSNLAMTMRTNPEIDTLSIDDLYNNLSKSSTNKVKSGFTGAYSTCTPSTSSTNIPEKEVLADIEEMDINWQIAMILFTMKGSSIRKQEGEFAWMEKHLLALTKRSLNASIVTTLVTLLGCTTKGTHDGKKEGDFILSTSRLWKQEKNQMGFAEIVDFLRGSNLRYALTSNPTIYDSLVKQFWQTATINTIADGTLEIHATIDTKGYTITEASIRDTLQLADATGITMLPNDEIFEGMGQMGYPTDGTFTFWKSFFTPQWRYLVHHLLHCISSKSGGWDQFGSNIATALICLSTDRVYNFSKLIFDGMVANLKSKTKFLMYPRFLQLILNIQTENKHLYLAVTLTKKIFGNMKNRGFEVAPGPLLPENTDLKQTKLTMGNAIVKLVKKVKKLEGFLKRRNMVLSDSEEEEPEAQGRKSQDDPLDSLVQGLVTPSTTKVDASGEEQVEDISPNTLEAAKTLSRVASLKPKSIDKGRRYKRRKETKGKKVVSSLVFQEEVDTGAKEVNTAEGVNTGSIKLSTVSEQVSTGSAKKSTPSPDKGQRAGKAPMIIEETPKKSKEQILQEEASLAEAIRLDTLQKEEVAKQVHLDSLLAQRIAEEEELISECQKSILGSDLQGEDFAKEDVDLSKSKEVNNLFTEERARAALRNKSLTQSQLKTYMMKLFEESGDMEVVSAEEFNKELSQPKTPKRLKDDKDVEAKDDEPTKKSGRRKRMARKGMHTTMKTPSVATYKIIKQGEKGVYQIVREDGTDIVYINFGAMLKSISRDDLTELYRIVMNRYGMDGPEDKLEKGFWKCLRTMFEEPLNTDSIWSELGQQKIISWRYYDTCRVHCLNLESMDVYMLSERKYPLSAEVCQTMLKMKLLDGKMNEDCYRLLKMMEKQAGIRK
ncbi:hypothetical protein Tco_0722441 [Tanacetum coccineum]